jgi:hypothetical protein
MDTGQRSARITVKTIVVHRFDHTEASAHADNCRHAQLVEPGLQPHPQRPKLRGGHAKLTADSLYVVTLNIEADHALAFARRKARQQILHYLSMIIGHAGQTGSIRDGLSRHLSILDLANVGRQVHVSVLHQQRRIAKAAALNPANHPVEYFTHAAIHLRGRQFAGDKESHPAAQKPIQFLHTAGVSLTYPVNQGLWADANRIN